MNTIVETSLKTNGILYTLGIRIDNENFYRTYANLINDDFHCELFHKFENLDEANRFYKNILGLSNKNEMVAFAILLALKFYDGKTLENGCNAMEFYFNIAKKYFDPNYQVVGLLQNILKDKNIEKKIFDLLFPLKIIEAIDILTKKEEDLDSYLKNLRKNSLAYDIKFDSLNEFLKANKKSKQEMNEEELKCFKKYADELFKLFFL